MDELAEQKLRKSAALDRLRASVYEMREPMDLTNVIASLEGTLRDMGVKFDDYSVQIIDEEESKASHSWRAHGLYYYLHDLTTRMPTAKTAYYEAWRDKRPIYRKDLQAEDSYNERESIWTSYVKHIRSVLDVPFSQGTVAINSVLPGAFSEADIKSLEQVAEVLSEAYTRFEDIRNLRESEAELRKHRDHLEKLVEERATELKETNVELQLEIEEHKRTEGELREQMNLNRILIDQMPCIALLIRSETREIVVSNKFAAEAGAIPGKQCFRTWGQRDDPCPWCLAPTLWATGAAQQTEFEDLGVIWDIHWIPVGKDLYFHYAFDVTEKRRMESELLKTQKLESIGILAGGIAHDFNNILTGIMGNISLAEMYTETGKSAGKVLERLREAEKASIRAKALTQQLLTFSSGGAPIRAVASIAELLRDSATLASSGSNIRCEFSIADDLRSVKMDSGQMDQVISNIVINANQAMASGGIVAVSAENMAVNVEHGLPLEDGEYVKISIEDHGIGIPEADLSKIFDPYFTTKQMGSGLGLAISYSIVEKHDGYIAAESQIDVGTTVHIYMPASLTEEPIAGKKQEEKPIEVRGKILVMDDEEIVRELASNVINDLGYRAIVAVDGDDAIRLYKAAMESGNPFEAVILDLTIPGGMGGKEAIQKLMEIDPEVKAIVSSGYSNDPVMTDFRQHGFSDVIAKPYKVGDLREVLHQVIAGAGGGIEEN